MTRVENPAVEPTFPVAPQGKRIILIAAVLGGLIALFLAFFLFQSFCKKISLRIVVI